MKGKCGGRGGWQWLVSGGSAVLLWLVLACPAAAADWPKIILSWDETPISYQVYGSGEPTLVFVHDWCADSRYWQLQIDEFSKKYRVVVLDLAGHGHSGMMRQVGNVTKAGFGNYSLFGFAEDVRRVIRSVGAKSVVLIGHGMGGEIAGYTAWLMTRPPAHKAPSDKVAALKKPAETALPDAKVLGVIGVDSFANLEEPTKPEEARDLITELGKNFAATVTKRVSAQFHNDVKSELKEWVIADMAAEPPFVGFWLFSCFYQSYYVGEVAHVFDALNIPIVGLHSDMQPDNQKINKRYLHKYTVIPVTGGDHFMMLNRPGVFNNALSQAIFSIMRQSAQ